MNMAMKVRNNTFHSNWILINFSYLLIKDPLGQKCGGSGQRSHEQRCLLNRSVDGTCWTFGFSSRLEFFSYIVSYPKIITVYRVHPPTRGRRVLVACGPGNNGEFGEQVDEDSDADHGKGAMALLRHDIYGIMDINLQFTTQSRIKTNCIT
jgi:hypothetical protein